MSDPIKIDDMSSTTFRCRPWDIDMFLELNNGRMLTLYDLGSFDFSIRVGLARVLRQKGWGLVVAGSSARYRRRIRMFDKVTIHTHVAGFDHRWIYVEQSMWVKGAPVSSVLLRTGITSKGKVVPVDDVVEALGLERRQREPDGWIRDWIYSEDKRIWPPPTGGGDVDNSSVG